MNIKAVALVVALLPAGTAAAQSKAAITGFADVNLGLDDSAQRSFTSSASMPSHGETSLWSYNYKVPTMKGIDIGGGILFTKSIGVGIAVSSVGSSGGPTLTDKEPNPYFANAGATGTLNGQTALRRHERGVHLSFVFKPTPNTRKLQLRLYGGPTHFSITQELVDHFSVAESSSPSSADHTLTITHYTTTEARGAAWGLQGGADVAYFFTKSIGVGGHVHYARGSVTIPDSARNLISTGQTQDVSVGGLSLGFGLRARF